LKLKFNSIFFVDYQNEGEVILANNYGPWATPINTGSNPQLSEFWKRRLTMLVPTSQTSPVLSRRNLLWLGAAGTLTSILPTFHAASVEADEEKSTHEGEKFSSGRIFCTAVWKIKSQDSDQDQYFRGIIAIDPETGAWDKIVTGDDVSDVRVSPDGKTLAYTNIIYNWHEKTIGDVKTVEIWIFNRESKKATKILDERGYDDCCWSPDGKQIIATKYSTTPNDNTHRTTWQVNVDGSGLKKLHIPETDVVGDWTCDGKWLVTVADRESSSNSGCQLYRIHPDGSEESCLTKGGSNYSPRFSPDSRQILYHRSVKKLWAIHIMDVDGQNDREVLREEEMEGLDVGCFSPDSRRLAVRRFTYELDEKGEQCLSNPELERYRYEIMNADGTNRRELTLIGAKIVWLGKPDWR
jgi:dipeptidyl aminopeptidase/acylaminoacyl peptidase